MCGIAGIAGSLADGGLVPSMLKMLQHRGPDSHASFISDNVHIGHCRLAINDLSERAEQPFRSHEYNVAVAVNGEIYNFRNLKSSLQQKGYVFRSNSDSEVVLHAYIEWGLEFIRELNGMFAVSIWDGRTKELFLFRDRLGIKPLYYAIVKESLLFASEIKALALHRAVDLSLDEQSFAEYLAFENYFSNRTLNKGIKLVEPAEIVRFRVLGGVIERKYYWQHSFDGPEKTASRNLYEEYLHIAETSVERHLVSDVPVGSYLSAGIDSPSVAYWASRKLDGVLKTYSGSFGNRGFYDEASDASRVAEQIGCLNKRVEITPDDFIRNIEDVLWHLDEPKVGMGSFSQYMVAKEAARDVKVILTGHGGDELFAGYPVFKAVYGKRNIPKLLANSSFRELVQAAYFVCLPKIRKEIGYFLPNIFPVSSLNTLLNSDFHSALLQRSDVFSEPEKLRGACDDEYRRLTLTYLKYYLPSLFIVEDKISMAFSLESRTPLCDNEMVDFALSIPLSDKLAGYELKHVPRTAMKGKLPDFIYKLPKRGFPTPLRFWFKKELREKIKMFIYDSIDSVPVLNQGEVKRIVSTYQNLKIETPWNEIYAHRIWIILNLIFYFNNQKMRYRNVTSRWS